VTGGKNEPVTSQPRRVGGVTPHDLLIQQVRDGGEADCSPWVPMTCVLDRISGKNFGYMNCFSVNVTKN
jgi:hypothetical protein